MAGSDINTEEGQRELAAKLDSDSSGLVQSKGIGLKRQAQLGNLAVLSISRYSAVADDRAGLRTFSKDVLCLDPVAIPAHLIEVAALLDFWESCKSRSDAQHKTAHAGHSPMGLRQMTAFQGDGLSRTDRCTGCHHPVQQVRLPQGSIRCGSSSGAHEQQGVCPRHRQLLVWLIPSVSNTDGGQFATAEDEHQTHAEMDPEG